MSNFSIGIVTPSYPPDFERCKLLVQSVQRFISPSLTHYIVVKQKDYKLFSQLKGPNTEILVVESILPWWLQKMPFVKNGWVSLKGALVRNWILQQIVKVAVAQAINKDVLAFVDSDVAFVRPFDFYRFIDGDKVRLFRVKDANPMGSAQQLDDVDRNTHKLLGLPSTHIAHNYEGQIITWRRDNALKLHQYLESISEKDWVSTLCKTWLFYEYVLYGVFVDEVLAEKSGHFYDDSDICHAYWEGTPMSDAELEGFFATLKPNHVAVMLSSKANIPVDRYRRFVESVPT